MLIKNNFRCAKDVSIKAMHEGLVGCFDAAIANAKKNMTVSDQCVFDAFITHHSYDPRIENDEDGCQRIIEMLSFVGAGGMPRARFESLMAEEAHLLESEEDDEHEHRLFQINKEYVEIAKELESRRLSHLKDNMIEQAGTVDAGISAALLEANERTKMLLDVIIDAGKMVIERCSMAGLPITDICVSSEFGRPVMSDGEPVENFLGRVR